MSIWPSLEKSRLRLGSERGTVVKSGAEPLSVALAFPNTYRAGMSSLGFQIIYRLLNAREDTLCERVFYPDPGEAAGFPSGRLFTMESQRPVADYSLLAFSLSFEMDIPNLLRMISLAGMPLRAVERGAEHPLVLVGGPVATFNPEPLAEFVDFFLIGEAEGALDEIADELVRDSLNGHSDRGELLYRLAGIGGVYVPSLYEAGYNEDGTLAELLPRGGAPRRIRRRWQAQLDPYPACSAIISPEAEFADTWLVEISRGCGRRCRFCMAGHCYLPSRRRSPEAVVAAAREGLALTERIGLVGAAVSDYPGIDALSRQLVDMGASISVASLRVDTLGCGLLQALAASGARTLTVAPEAGSDRLRQVIGKGIGRDDILRAAAMAASAGFSRLRFYFMVGLPTEEDEDVEAAAELVLAARKEAPGLQIQLSVAPFVPKPFTPFQWAPMLAKGRLEGRVRLLRSLLRRHGAMETDAESPRWSIIQGILARGDRRLAPVLERVSGEGDSIRVWQAAMRDAGLEEAFYLYRPRDGEEIFPWDHLDIGWEKSFLYADWLQSGAMNGPGGESSAQQ